jgi:CMP-N-acetylneuraminic acid synthetase
MNIYALQTARGGSKSVINKNILNVKGIPLYLHNILHTKNVSKIKGTYISTDIPYIIDHQKIYNYKIIDRPEELKGDDASHSETMIHGLLEIEKDINAEVDILVVLLGNSIGAFAEDIEKGIQLLIDNPDADSVESVSEYNMYNPFRSLKIKDGYLDTILPQQFIEETAVKKNINDRKAAGNTYYFNGSFWIIRRQVLLNNQGLYPFHWLGNKILPLIQSNFMEVDAMWQLSYLQNLDVKIVF